MRKCFQDATRGVTAQYGRPYILQCIKEDRFPSELWQALGKFGLLGLSIPEEYGGSGGGVLEITALNEALALAGVPTLMLVVTGLARVPIVRHGTPEQIRKYVTPTCSGERKLCFAITEPDAGTNSFAMTTLATPNAKGGWTLNGQKVFISGGSVADYVCFFAKTGTDGTRAVSAFVVPTDSPGFSVPRCDRKMGVIGVPTANIVLEGCRVPAANRLGEEGRGFRTAMLTLNTCRPVVGARGLGLAEGAIAYALDFARQRKAFGSPLVEHQAIQFMLADAAIQIEASRHLVYHGAWLVDQGKYDREHAFYLSIAKTFATEMANRVASDAIQILGAQGYMKDHPLERHYRDARQLMIVEGTSQIQRLVIARAMVQGEIGYW